ncbi:MAG: DUF938 domain-containing protein [Halofilum sp. (in: g-proteobacteria)]|nr:DUF938 domain-containing protein [Halofilum sp. (in: g-proteobacteria)]
MQPEPPAEPLYSAAAERNAPPILEVLRRRLPAAPARVLEVAAGGGQHAAQFARALPHLAWLPSDPDPAALASIRAWAERLPSDNLEPPLALDVCADHWPVRHADAVVCINLLHIAPWHATPGLCVGAARLLPAGGELLVYGPFRVGGRHTADSNARFDDQLRRRRSGLGHP